MNNINYNKHYFNNKFLNNLIQYSKLDNNMIYLILTILFIIILLKLKKILYSKHLVLSYFLILF